MTVKMRMTVDIIADRGQTAVIVRRITFTGELDEELLQQIEEDAHVDLSLLREAFPFAEAEEADDE